MTSRLERNWTWYFDADESDKKGDQQRSPFLFLHLQRFPGSSYCTTMNPSYSCASGYRSSIGLYLHLLTLELTQCLLDRVPGVTDPANSTGKLKMRPSVVRASTSDQRSSQASFPLPRKISLLATDVCQTCKCPTPTVQHRVRESLPSTPDDTVENPPFEL